MFRPLLVAFVSSLLLLSQAAFAQPVPQRVVQPLAPSQLTAEEQLAFGRLTPGSEEAGRYLYTRTFHRDCRLVVDLKKPPLELPLLEGTKFSEAYLSAEERASCATAVRLFFRALSARRPTRSATPPNLPGLPPVTNASMAPLTPSQLYPEERAKFDALAPGSEAAQRFLYTRGFIRYCQFVADGRVQAGDLPIVDDKGMDNAYVSAAETNVCRIALRKYFGFE